MILSWLFTIRQRRHLHFLRWAYRRGFLTEYPRRAAYVGPPSTRVEGER